MCGSIRPLKSKLLLMKNKPDFMKRFKKLKFFLFASGLLVFLVISRSCEMPATGFKEVEEGGYIEKDQKAEALIPDSSIVVMTWNIRYGFGRGPWFGDACGYKVIYSEEEILANLELIAARIRQVNPDILLLQEADINSSRSAYVNELRWLLDKTDFNYAVFGLQWKAQFVPSDGLGRIEETNAILSRWKLKDAKRFQLDRRQDQIAIERYFYERYCMLEATVEIPGYKDLVLLNIHASAFATDDTKFKNLKEFKEELDIMSESGKFFVAGGDLNTLPPGSDKTDYCIEDMCPGESFHQQGNDPMHKIGCDYTPEKEWIVSLYDSYQSVITPGQYLSNQEAYFTHTTRPGHFWDRTLDYLFTNNRWRSGASFVRQDFTLESDHAPVGGELILKSN
jgi:endonuclease/exonuclease/phosphatase family metal-dependent hydrolase